MDLNAETLKQRLRDVAERLKKQTVTRSEFVREAGISAWQVGKHFDNWSEFVSAAGLQPNDLSRIEDDDLFAAMREAFLAAGCICTTAKFERLCRYSYSVYKKRAWGGWNGVLFKFREWALIHDPGFPFLASLPNEPTAVPDSVVQDAKREGAAWLSKGGRQYGPFLNFRGLQHAPINEQGVVFLFGMVAMELGYIVESVATGFPDCEAKRRVNKAGDNWERVRIEFEYQSRTFLAHGHRPDGCDVIVCWEDNWPDCPVEVLELRSAIVNLES
jgi:hypothetical protein